MPGQEQRFPCSLKIVAHRRGDRAMTLMPPVKMAMPGPVYYPGSTGSEWKARKGPRETHRLGYASGVNRRQGPNESMLRYKTRPFDTYLHGIDELQSNASRLSVIPLTARTTFARRSRLDSPSPSSYPRRTDNRSQTRIQIWLPNDYFSESFFHFTNGLWLLGLEGSVDGC